MRAMIPSPHQPGGSQSGILPLPTVGGIQVISINMMLPNEADAVVW